jgi:hypothetical protein
MWGKWGKRPILEKTRSRGPVLCSSRFVVYWPRRVLNVAGRVAARRGVMA